MDVGVSETERVSESVVVSVVVSIHTKARVVAANEEDRLHERMRAGGEWNGCAGMCRVGIICFENKVLYVNMGLGRDTWTAISGVLGGLHEDATVYKRL
jgi:hypothetical protein